MKINRVKLVLTFIVVALLFSSCQDSTKNATKVANTFLDHFLKLEYQEAATHCTEHYSEEIERSLKSVEALPEDMKERMREEASKVKREILSVKQFSTKDSLLVTHQSTLPDIPTPQEGNLLLVKEEGAWKVAGYRN